MLIHFFIFLKVLTTNSFQIVLKLGTTATHEFIDNVANRTVIREKDTRSVATDLKKLPDDKITVVSVQKSCQNAVVAK